MIIGLLIIGSSFIGLVIIGLFIGLFIIGLIIGLVMYNSARTINHWIIDNRNNNNMIINDRTLHRTIDCRIVYRIIHYWIVHWRSLKNTAAV